MNILFTICGRAGSKGIKNKNLREFCGKPLVYYTVSAIDLYLKRHPEIAGTIVVNSDSKELLQLVAQNGMRPVQQIARDERLAGDVVGKVAVVKNCLDIMGEQSEITFDMVVDLDITSPLRTVADLEAVICKQMESNADVTTTVAPARRNPYFNQVKRVGRGVKKVIESEYTARQQAPKIYDMNASIYAFRPAFLKTTESLWEGYCEIVEMIDTGFLDLDHEKDFEFMEVIADYLFQVNIGFSEIRDHIRDQIMFT